MHSLSLKLVRSDNVSNRDHLVLIDRVKILGNVLWNNKTAWNHKTLTEYHDNRRHANPFKKNMSVCDVQTQCESLF